jgi:ParB/RepB/Spo0J family partition protein
MKKINVDDIVPNLYNPREKISRREVTEIRDSIKEMGGILVPLVVFEKNGKFVLLDGERRWRAAKELSKYDPKYKEVPANIVSGPLSKNDNIRTMFNIHMERQQWSTSAIAETIGVLFQLNPDMTTKELANITHVVSYGFSIKHLPINFQNGSNG